MNVLDTDTLTLLQRGQNKVAGRARESTARGEILAITIITYCEQIKGRIQNILTAASGPQLVEAYEKFLRTRAALDEMLVLPVTQDAADLFDQLRVDKRVRKRGAADLLNACISITFKATFATRNTKDYAGIPGLKLANWAD